MYLKFYGLGILVLALFINAFPDDLYKTEAGLDSLIELLLEYPDSAVGITEELFREAAVSGDTERAGRLQYLLGLGNYYRGFYRIAAFYFETALTEAGTKNDTLLQTSCLNNAGICYELTGETEKAISSYRRCMELDLMRGDSLGAMQTLINLGQLYSYTGHKDLALTYLLDAEDYFNEHPDPANQALVFQNLGNHYGESGEYAQAEEKMLRALKIYRDHEVYYNWIQQANNLGELFTLMEDYTQAQIWLDSAGVKAREHGYMSLLAQNYLKSARLSQFAGNYAAADSVYSEAARILINTDQPEDKKYLLEKRLELYSQMDGDPRIARELNAYIALRDTLADMKNHEILLENNIRYRTDQLRRNIENQAFLIRSQSQKMQGLVYFSILGFIVTVVIVYFLIKIRNKNHLLSLKNEELSILREKFRHRHEEHDGPSAAELRWKKIREIIEKDEGFLDRNLNLTDIASRTGSNVKYVSADIREFTGYSFTDYVNYLRIERAKQLLKDDRDETYSVAAIAELSGFGSSSRFYEIFKAHTGVPPSSFRHLILSEEAPE